MIIVYVTNTTFDTDKFREVDVVRFGKDDAQTADEVSPYGYDSNPIKDIGAAFSETVSKGDTIVLGYFLKNKKAQPGESRIYSTDANGVEQARIWLHADGTVELGGTGDAGSNANHATQYEALKTAFDALKSDFNKLVTAFNTHVHSTVTGLGSPTAPTPVVGSIPASTSSADMSNAKLTKIKTE